MPWSEGSDNLLLATDGARVETDCGTDHKRSRIAVHVHLHENRAFGVLVLAYVGVTLSHDWARIGPGNVELRP